MPLELRESVAILDGICAVGEAEALLSWLQTHPQGPVDIAGCSHVHTAVLQVLMAARPTVVGDAADADVSAWSTPLLHAAAGKDVRATTQDDGSSQGSCR